ncbi:angiopoietin-related protein 3-like isoform X1 [Xiphophorus couchianus]|uniref:angiopoietin-related protein 3-like isoform X1 n=1 Tax=Xiphophorus couchianus TaxID=32473 RepID=UPI0010161B1B|nr:angiopoietin-related protein 3-like isoform X1 [Xiphophorus couchianus]
MKTTPVPVVFLLVLASVPVPCDSSQPPVLDLEALPETRSLFAPLDDVHLLSSGLLQLGQSMREFVQKTKGQINTIFQKLNIFDRSFVRLTALAGEIKESEEELKQTAAVLNTHNEEIKELSEKISVKVESILQEKGQLLNKVEIMEEKLSSLSVDLVTGRQAAEINSLREVIQRQEQSINNLLAAMVEQGRHLDHQTMKIKLLEEKLAASASAQETFEKMAEISMSELPTAAPFLTSDTSSSATMSEMNILFAADFPSDCSELFDRGERANGTYAIKPNGSEPFMVFCDMSRGRGATVIQQRRDGSMNFDQPWEKYENGFGELQGEFWLGLKKMYSLASQGNSVLHIQLEDWKQNRHFIEYRFYLEGPVSNYTIRLVYLSGSLPNPLSNHTGVVFSTKDRDNGRHWASRCSHPQSGGWWFSSCGDTNLNERYSRVRANGRSERRRGIQWRSGRKTSHSFAFTQISIHPMDSVNSL